MLIPGMKYELPQSTCKWTMIHQICSNLIFINRNNTEVRYRCSNFAPVKLAGSTISPSVRIILLAFQSTSLEGVLKSRSHQPSIAA